MEEQQRAFEDLMAHMAYPTTLGLPREGAPVLLYIAAMEGAISTVLVEEHYRSGCPEQTPICYVSETLSGAKTHYSELEKMVYTLVMASQKLKHYFNVHPIIVPTNFSIRYILSNREVTWRIGKWAAEMVPFDLSFVACNSVKSLVLADFVVEWTPTPAGSIPEAFPPTWTAYVDGAWGSELFNFFFF